MVVNNRYAKNSLTKGKYVCTLRFDFNVGV